MAASARKVPYRPTASVESDTEEQNFGKASVLKFDKQRREVLLAVKLQRDAKFQRYHDFLVRALQDCHAAFSLASSMQVQEVSGGLLLLDLDQRCRHFGFAQGPPPLSSLTAPLDQ